MYVLRVFELILGVGPKKKKNHRLEEYLGKKSIFFPCAQSFLLNQFGGCLIWILI